jgi:hypothetical protein
LGLALIWFCKKPRAKHQEPIFRTPACDQPCKGLCGTGTLARELGFWLGYRQIPKAKYQVTVLGFKPMAKGQQLKLCQQLEGN